MTTAKGPLSHVMGGGHAQVDIKDLVVPAENLLGGEGGGFNMGQHRLAYGRLRHGMHNVAMAQRALDMAVAHITQRKDVTNTVTKARTGSSAFLINFAVEKEDGVYPMIAPGSALHEMVRRPTKDPLLETAEDE